MKSGFKILETGAGTGAYSIELANNGYEVDALELIEKNLNCLKKKIKSEMKINPVLGDARELSMYNENTFDMVLCLGPMYHLNDWEDRNKCIEESIRVCKPGGIIFFEYISSNLTFVKNIKRIDNYLRDYKEEFGNSFELENKTFSYLKPFDFEKNIEKYPIKKLHHIGIDGVSSLIEEKVNSFEEDEFKIWLKFLRNGAEDITQLSYSENILFIAQKK